MPSDSLNELSGSLFFLSSSSISLTMSFQTLLSMNWAGRKEATVWAPLVDIDAYGLPALVFMLYSNT